MDVLYQDLSYLFEINNIKFETNTYGLNIKYDSSIDNYVAKLLQDFYHLVGYNVLLLNQNGDCKICIEIQNQDLESLFMKIKSIFDTYNEDVDYVSLMDKDVKCSFGLFKKSLKYQGNFGIGVKNLAEVYN